MAETTGFRRVNNPPNPWRTQEVEWIGPAPETTTEVFEETAASILSENRSPDVGFRYSVNPYRGCFHGCAYCYARPTHEYIDFGAGDDFDRKIIVKKNAPQLLRRAFEKKSWRGELVTFSGVTDCYQPLEANYRLTRECLEVCRDYNNPVGILTKSALIRRDIDVLADLARDARLSVYVSIPFVDPMMARTIEPHTASPAARFATIAALAEANIPVGVAVAPIIPALNDQQIPEILDRAHAAGARHAFRILLRLPGSVRDVFTTRLEAAFPLRARHVLDALADQRGDDPNGTRLGTRFEGQGPRWQAVEGLFRVTCKRLGIEALEERHAHAAAEETTFRRPLEQGELFGED